MGIFPELAIVIVNYNLKADTIDCINSLLQSGAAKDRILVVDNASSDGSVETFYEIYGEQLNIIRAPVNRGYPGALNLGIPRAMSLGARWILMMNNDTRVSPEFINELEKAVLLGPQYALIGPLILYFDEPEIIWYLGYRLIPGTLIGVGSHRGRRVSKSLPPLVPMDLMHGCAMMVRRDVFETIGFFDDSQTIYGDDADFSLRAKRAGFKAAAATRAVMWHKVSFTMGYQKPRTRYLKMRNTIFFYRKYSRGANKVLMRGFTLARCLFLIISDVLHGYKDLVKPLWYGWSDGWAGRNFNRY
jgi:GT2 family glycosyltransferase